MLLDYIFQILYLVYEWLSVEIESKKETWTVLNQ